ncbi:hypothetical protein BJ508DRAFT_375416 [Ascobolus immersus RN42]|uniref:Uncharacterized protein n=1 Tax=Ascobolus immersus RN42 TaxID=1160509 RepID=A0A3N4IBU3_ASCIM|nr:hypothetical protein BJ508DRAFT_375416 [Ascobolus immersus RN42]
MPSPGPAIIRSSLRLATLKRQAEEASKTQSKETEMEYTEVRFVLWARRIASRLYAISRGVLVPASSGCWFAPGKFERPYMSALHMQRQRAETTILRNSIGAWANSFKRPIGPEQMTTLFGMKDTPNVQSDPVHRASISFLRHHQPLWAPVEGLKEAEPEMDNTEEEYTEEEYTEEENTEEEYTEEEYTEEEYTEEELRPRMDGFLAQWHKVRTIHARAPPGSGKSVLIKLLRQYIEFYNPRATVVVKNQLRKPENRTVRQQPHQQKLRSFMDKLRQLLSELRIFFNNEEYMQAKLHCMHASSTVLATASEIVSLGQYGFDAMQLDSGTVFLAIERAQERIFFFPS